MEKQFLEVIADILEVEPDELSMETNFRDDKFDWDSLKGYAMLVTFEEDFNKELPVEEFLKMETIADLYKYVV